MALALGCEFFASLAAPGVRSPSVSSELCGGRSASSTSLVGLWLMRLPTAVALNFARGLHLLL